MCTLTGSVKEMATSPDFYQLFKRMFKLKHLGLWWTMARTKSKGGTKYQATKNTIHVEIDRCDEAKIKNIEAYFSSSSKKVDDNLLGTPLCFVPCFNFFGTDDEKARIVEHSKNQAHLEGSIKSVAVSGLQLNNWFDRPKRHTLLRKSMLVKILYEKAVVKKGSESKSWKDRLFYTILSLTCLIIQQRSTSVMPTTMKVEVWQKVCLAL